MGSERSISDAPDWTTTSADSTHLMARARANTPLRVALSRRAAECCGQHKSERTAAASSRFVANVSSLSQPEIMRTTLFTCLVALATTACSTVPSARPVTATPPAGAVRHVVVFKFKPDASPEKIRQITDAFAALKDQIPGVLSFEHGVNNSPEKLNQGFTHVYQLTFTNAAARDTYLVHPAHKAFGALLGGLGVFDGAFVVDYAPVP
jgi:hypothetical protein